MKKTIKKVLSVLIALAILLVPMTAMAALGDYDEPWQLPVAMGMMDRLAVYVEPGATQYVQAAEMNGTVTVGYATGEYQIYYGRMPVLPETESGNFTAEFTLMGYDMFSIYNPSETDAITVYLMLTAGSAEIPVGTWDNPETVETLGAQAATVEAATDGYFYTWTAPAYGKVSVAIADESGWQYMVSKTPADEEDYASYYSGDLHTYDGEPVVASEEITVYAGDKIEVMVNTYDPENMWSAPAGTINWSLNFESIATFIVEDVTAGVGQEVKVAIGLENNPGIVSLKLDVAYDKDVLEFVEVTAGDFAASSDSAGESVPNYNFGPADADTLAINWIAALSEENITTNGTVATITFKVKDTAVCGDSSDITVTYDPENVFDKDLNNVEIGLMNGSVEVDHTLTYVDEIPATCTESGVQGHDKCEVCGKCFNWGMEVAEEDLVTDPYHDRTYVEEVPATRTETGVKEHYVCPCGTLWVFDWDTFEFTETTAEELIIPVLSQPGDVNGDDVVNNKDLAVLMQQINGWPVEIDMSVADVNGDNTVNNKDLALLMQYINGWPVELK